jgi:hypothetical protein
MTRNSNRLKPGKAELQQIQGQLRREIELAHGKGIPTREAQGLLAKVNQDLERLREKESKGNLFDVQMELF